MKRLLFVLGFAGLGLFVGVATAFAQGGTAGDGFPPQSTLYADAVLLARVLPIVIALGVGIGVWRGKQGLHERKSAPDSPTVIRHDWGTVTAHWFNAVGFIVGMVTGLIALRWLPRPDDMRAIFALHYVGSGLAVFGVAHHLAHQAITAGTGLIPRSFKDWRDGFSEIVEYTGVFGSQNAVLGLKIPKGLREPFAQTLRAFGIRPPKQLGKYLPAEKAFSYTPWAIIIGVIVITGLVKSFRYLYPIPPDFVALMSTLHDWFAVASVVMLAIHLSAVMLVPHNWPLLKSMFTTRVPRKFVEQSHLIWFRELVAQEQETTAPSPSAPTATAAPQPKA